MDGSERNGARQIACSHTVGVADNDRAGRTIRRHDGARNSRNSTTPTPASTTCWCALPGNGSPPPAGTNSASPHSTNAPAGKSHTHQRPRFQTQQQLARLLRPTRIAPRTRPRRSIRCARIRSRRLARRTMGGVLMGLPWVRLDTQFPEQPENTRPRGRQEFSRRVRVARIHGLRRRPRHRRIHPAGGLSAVHQHATKNEPDALMDCGLWVAVAGWLGVA